MMQNACIKCKIYFPENVGMHSCPKCGTSLSTMKNDNRYEPYRYYPSTGLYEPITSEKGGGNGEDASRRSASAVRNRGNVYTGRITDYRTEEIEPAFMDEMSLFFHGMHHGHTRHEITFLLDSGDTSYHVVFYGQFSSNSVMPSAGSAVTVRARPSGPLFTTENVYIERSRIRLRSQTVPGRHRINPAVILIAVVLLVLAVAGYFFFPVIKSVIATFLTVLICLFIAAIAVPQLRFLLRSPVVLLVLSAVITALLYNVGGLGDAIGELIPSFAVIAIMLFGIIMIIRSVF